MSARNYCFTLFFFGAEGLSPLEEACFEAGNLCAWFADPLFKYVIVNVEQCPNTQRVHWQGYMELTSPVRYSAVKVKCPALQTAHFEKRQGTRDQARAYCQKEESQVAGPFEYGDWGIGQGNRTDLDDVAAAITAGAREQQIARDFPVQYIKFARGIKMLLAMQDPTPNPDPTFSPRPWQQRVLNLLALPQNDRQIIWITDSTGGRGKTRLTTHLLSEHRATALSGRLADMTYAYYTQTLRTPPQIVCFDITRAAQESTGHLYSMAEALKSGRLFNSKYESCAFTFPTPHVIFFANHSWDREKFSHDRVLELNLADPQHHQPLPPPPSEA